MNNNTIKEVVNAELVTKDRRVCKLNLIAHIVDKQYQDHEFLLCNLESGIIIDVHQDESTWFEFFSGADVIHYLTMATEDEDTFSVELNPAFQKIEMFEGISKFHFFSMDNKHPYTTLPNDLTPSENDFVMEFFPIYEFNKVDIQRNPDPAFPGVVRLTFSTRPLLNEECIQGFLAMDNLFNGELTEDWCYGYESVLKCVLHLAPHFVPCD